MSEIVVVDGIEYTKSNKRMRYNAELHDKHREPWTVKDQIYMCGMWGGAKARDISLALGRTEGTCMHRVAQLKKSGEFNKFKKMFKEA